MSRRIFISSVMRDFDPQRAATKEAILSLRHHPVMAEDFGAQPFSSQTACLEGVRSSEIYVGIFGPRYGYKAPASGLSATEEEFNEARHRGLSILCFEQTGAKEADQGAFLERIKAYETGYAFAFFDTPEQLKMKVVQAINDLIGQPGISTLDPAEAAGALNCHQWGSRRFDQYGTWLGAVLIPARQGESFLDVLEFSQKDLCNRLLQPALFGPETLLSVDLGVRTTEEGDALVFSQGEDRRQTAAVLEIHADGALVFGTALSRDADKFSSLGRSYVINEKEVERRLAAFTTYGTQFYQGLVRGEVITNLYFGASLTGIEHKAFGQLPSYPLNSFTVPMHGLPNPLKVPSIPLRISRAELANPISLSRTMTGHIARTFRNANAYYTPGSGPRGGAS